MSAMRQTLYLIHKVCGSVSVLKGLPTKQGSRMSIPGWASLALNAGLSNPNQEDQSILPTLSEVNKSHGVNRNCLAIGRRNKVFWVQTEAKAIWETWKSFSSWGLEGIRKKGRKGQSPNYLVKSFISPFKSLESVSVLIAAVDGSQKGVWHWGPPLTLCSQSWSVGVFSTYREYS